MFQEAVPEQAPSDRAVSAPGTPAEQGSGAPADLPQQRVALTALTADLSQLDADLQSWADRADGERGHRAS
ncbi:hypothetical protein ACF053_20535 [Streptomyces kanasensis]|uniref:hypothetical protein n=1 Tax=Streptomyces kanasensis TaxID=936756 RepID=UPI0036F5C476